MRGRVAVTTFAAFAALALPTGALASTSQQIFSDAADGHLDGSYSKGDLQHAMHDSTVQGYGNPIIQITLTNVINNSNTNNNSNSNSNTSSNTNSNTNNSTSNATGGSANATSTSNANAAANASCGPGSASASNSGASSNSSSGGGHSCAGQPSGKQVFTPPVRSGGYGHQSRGGGVRGGGTLPFTGSHLAAFLSLGFALLAGGGILRLMARRRSIAG